MTAITLYDTFTIDGVRRTGDGYLAAFARVARTGIQEYRGSEIGRPDLDVVRVYRPESEVFNADALKSFAHRPVTLKHPPVPVTAKNWKKYSGGQTGDAVVRDGEFVRVPMVMMDQRIVDAYEKQGIKELSMGYSCDLKWEPGTTSRGEMYDAIQTDIRGNHLAVVPSARGGEMLRIGDDGSFRAMVDKLKAEGVDDEDVDDDEDYMSDEAFFYDTDFTAAQRKEAVKKGEAMPGGGFPIRNAEDLHHAMQAIGRAKDPAAAKAHIRKRAKEMGLESELSPAFKDASVEDAWSEEARAAAIAARQAAAHHDKMTDKHTTAMYFNRSATSITPAEKEQHENASMKHSIAAYHYRKAHEAFKGGEMKAGEEHAKLGKAAGKKADRMSSKLNIKDSSSTDDVDYVDCPQCGADLAPTASRCDTCGYVMPTKDGATIMKQIMVDGFAVDVVTDQGASIVDRHIGKLERDLKDARSGTADVQTQLDKANKLVQDAQTVVSAKDGEIAVLKKQVEDSKITPEKLDVLVKERMGVVDRAVTLLGKTFTYDGKSIEDIRRAAVAVKLSDAVAKAMDDAAISGAFTALTADAPKGGGARPFADALRGQSHVITTDATTARDAAFEEAQKRLNDAWKTKVVSV